MNEFKFKVAGSSGSSYEVHFVHEDDELYAFCTCKAGDSGQYCKHRFAILNGDASSVLSDNQEHVATVASWLPGSPLAKAIQEMQIAEDAVVKAKAEWSKTKKAVARAMRGQ